MCSKLIVCTMALAVASIVTAGTITGSLTAYPWAKGTLTGTFSSTIQEAPYATTGAGHSLITTPGTGYLDYDCVGQGTGGMELDASEPLQLALFFNFWRADMVYTPSVGGPPDTPSGWYRVGFRLSDDTSESIAATNGFDLDGENNAWMIGLVTGGRLTKPYDNSPDPMFVAVDWEYPSGSPDESNGGIVGTTWVFSKVQFAYDVIQEKWVGTTFLATGVESTHQLEAYVNAHRWTHTMTRHEQVELFSIAATPSPMLHGDFDPDGGHQDKPRGRAAIAEFREEGTQTVVMRVSLSPDEVIGGYEYAIPTPDTPDTYDLSIQYDHCLRKTITVDTDDLDTPVALELLNGDINLDNSIDIGDYAAYAESYEATSEDSDWDTPNLDGICPFDAILTAMVRSA